MRYDIVFGGKAGQGPNILTEVVSECLLKKGFYVFYSRDYQSLIRGGHNFNTLSFSDEPIASNTSKIDILVCLDKDTLGIHKKALKNKSIVLKGEEENMFFAGAVCKILGIDFKLLEDELRKLKNYEENLKHARKGYERENERLHLRKSRNSIEMQTRARKLKLPELNIKEKAQNISFMNGNQAISFSAVKSGLDYYYAYPMTPATHVLMELAQMQLEKNMKHKIIELENEIAVMIAALGSSITGKKTMVGTSGGGFDLMTEGLSMAGQAEIPIVVYLASRPGPSTGLATYSSQGDLNLALYSGHGEFSRVVIAPGDPKESIEATNQSFYFSQKYRIPSILLTDKHLAESKYVFENNSSLLPIENSITSLGRYNSYEHDENAIATEDAKITKKNFDRRKKKQEEINKEAENFEMLKIHGKQNSKNIVIGWGSTKGAILDAIKEEELDAKFLQIIYLEPFSKKIKSILEEAKKIIIVENNATSPLSGLISQKTGTIIQDKNKILRYDGRPFFSDELAKEIKERLK